MIPWNQGFLARFYHRSLAVLGIAGNRCTNGSRWGVHRRAVEHREVPSPPILGLVTPGVALASNWVRMQRKDLHNALPDDPTTELLAYRD